MWQEPDGKASFSRIATTVVLAAWLLWVSYCVYQTKSFPGGTWEVSAVIGVLYGVNKAADAATTIATGKK